MTNEQIKRLGEIENDLWTLARELEPNGDIYATPLGEAWATLRRHFFKVSKEMGFEFD